MVTLFYRLVTHGAALAAGIVLGIYLLPILTAPPAPDKAILERDAAAAEFQATLTRDLPGSDVLHWGEGVISLSTQVISLQGRLAPGPDYKLYLVKDFVDHEAAFLSIKAEAKYIADIKSFDGFSVAVPADVQLSEYTSVIIWCEAFGEFITAARYR